jgi:hypothetical protein
MFMCSSYTCRYQSHKKDKSSQQCLYVLWGSACVKASRIMLVKLIPSVNFINILLETFAPIFLQKKLLSPNVTREKLRKALLHEKFTCKMLMKLTPEGSCVRSKKESKKYIFLEKVS